MFKKLVSNLPFNPGLIQQISFYGKRLHREEAIRRMSFFFMGATLLINMVALAAPAQNSLATSPNDMIYGASSRNTVISAYKNNRDGLDRTDIRDIYDYYGITLSDIENATDVTVKSTDKDYVTTGRWLSPGDDDPQTIPGAQTTVYERSLRVWDIQNPYNTYPAITGKATGEGKLKGQTFWILLKGCGNITYIPQPKTPKIEIKKTRLGADKVEVGATVTYRIDYRNKGTGGAENVRIEDTLEDGTSFLNASTNPDKVNGQNLVWKIGLLEPSSEYQQIRVTVKVNNINEAKRRVCNVATMLSSNTDTATSKKVCFVINNECPRTGLPAPDGDLSKCEIICPDGTRVPYNTPDACPTVPPEVSCKITREIDRKNRTVIFKTTVESSKESVTKIQNYTYRYNDNSGPQVVATDKFSDTQSHTFPYGTFEVRVTIAYKVAGAKNPDKIRNVSCAKEINFEQPDNPEVSCKMTSEIGRRERKVTFKTKVESDKESATKIQSYTYRYDDGSGAQVVQSDKFSDTQTHTFPIGDFDVRVVVSYTVSTEQSGKTHNTDCGVTIGFEEPPAPTPLVICKKYSLLDPVEWNKRTAQLITERIDGGEVSKVTFVLDGKDVSSKNNPADTEEFTYTDLTEGAHTFTVKYVVKKGDLVMGSACIIEDEIEKPAPGITATKRAKNVTKNIDNADRTTASAGDIIEYSLITTNSGNGPAMGYVIKPDSLGRVLEYADLKDIDGATFDKTSQQLSWPPVDIKAGESVTKVFSVQVKNPIPTTAPSTSDPTSKQYTICNKYGNEVCIGIGKPIPAVVTTTAQKLPNTGPGQGLFFTFLTVCILGFFYSRSRVLAKEMDIIRYEYSKEAS